MRAVRFLFVTLLALAPVSALAADDPIADLAQAIRESKIRLEHDSAHGYLRSLLKNLNVPISSQSLVFSKTSLQSERISPRTPRAMYFNDDVYVAWVQGSATIEVMSVDPKRGAIFYALDQENDGRPQFEQVTGHVCSVCHFDQASKKFVPKLVLSSVIPDENGGAEGTYPFPINDRSPIEERWGGWYVTGTMGAQKHLGNVFMKTPMSPMGDVFSKIDYSKSLNVTDLSTRFNTAPYLSPHSDVVALMVLAHQTEVHNLIAIAHSKPDADPKEVGEPLVKALIFDQAVPFKEPVKGSSEFTKEFSSRGPLREFDLKTRLFRYPVSYMIYNKAFDELPSPVKTYVYRRLVEVLSKGGATGAETLKILRTTKPDFPR